MMRRSAGFHADEARRQLLKEWQNVPALELTANDYITCRVNSVDLKNRLSDIETNCRDRLHVWLLRIVGASTAPTSMALPCRWRSRPQHQKRTRAPQQPRTRLAYPTTSSAVARSVGGCKARIYSSDNILTLHYSHAVDALFSFNRKSAGQAARTDHALLSRRPSR